MTAVKLFYIFWNENCLHEGLASYRRSLEPIKENIQHFKMNIIYFFSLFVGHFLPSWIRIQQLKLMRIHPDPQPWKKGAA